MSQTGFLQVILVVSVNNSVGVHSIARCSFNRNMFSLFISIAFHFIFVILVDRGNYPYEDTRAHIFTYTYFHGIVEITEILSTLLDRHPDGVLEMLLFNRLGGGKFSENATPLSNS